jgi:hypothetical protein
VRALVSLKVYQITPVRRAIMHGRNKYMLDPRILGLASPRIARMHARPYSPGRRRRFHLSTLSARQEARYALLDLDPIPHQLQQFLRPSLALHDKLHPFRPHIAVFASVPWRRLKDKCDTDGGRTAT